MLHSGEPLAKVSIYLSLYTTKKKKKRKAVQHLLANCQQKTVVVAVELRPGSSTVPPSPMAASHSEGGDTVPAVLTAAPSQTEEVYMLTQSVSEPGDALGTEHVQSDCGDLMSR